MKHHPPIPWRWSEKGEFRTQDGRNSPSLIAANGYGILSCDGDENGPSEANGCLIVATPTLLKALQEVAAGRLAGEWQDDYHDRMVALARAAIAKAEGES